MGKFDTVTKTPRRDPSQIESLRSTEENSVKEQEHKVQEQTAVNEAGKESNSSSGESGKRGRKRLASSVFELSAANKIIEELQLRFPFKNISTLRKEFETYLEIHKSLSEPQHCALVTFIAGAVSNGMMYSSALETYNVLVKLYPAEDLKERLDRQRFYFSLNSARTLEDGSEPSQVPLATLISFVKAEEDVQRRSFLWLLLATGCRPNSIFYVPPSSWYFGEESVGVQWRKQKAQQQRKDRHDAEYMYTWSCPPDESVRQWLQSCDWTDWSTIAKPEQIASVVNSWLRRLHQKLEDQEQLSENAAPFTSSAFRDRMDAFLRSIQVTGEILKNLLDHTLKTSDAHYSVFKYSTPTSKA